MKSSFNKHDSSRNNSKDDMTSLNDIQYDSIVHNNTYYQHNINYGDGYDEYNTTPPRTNKILHHHTTNYNNEYEDNGNNDNHSTHIYYNHQNNDNHYNNNNDNYDDNNNICKITSGIAVVFADKENIHQSGIIDYSNNNTIITSTTNNNLNDHNNNYNNNNVIDNKNNHQHFSNVKELSHQLSDNHEYQDFDPIRVKERLEFMEKLSSVERFKVHNGRIV
jgi:hypothetical protein